MSEINLGQLTNEIVLSQRLIDACAEIKRLKQICRNEATVYKDVAKWHKDMANARIIEWMTPKQCHKNSADHFFRKAKEVRR